METIKTIVDTQLSLPEGFTVHPRLLPQLQRRAKMVDDGTIDWALGEMLAFGSLLIEGHPVRLAGQDSRRGTFGQRHAVLVDRTNGDEYTPLKNAPAERRRSTSTTRCCREFAAMGFEYGYSVARPDALVLWEAQFGDFADGAQTIVDEFISSGEAEVGPALRRHAAAAARLRGPGPRPLLRAHRAVPAAVRGEQHDRRGAVLARAILPPAAPAGAAQAARGR